MSDDLRLNPSDLSGDDYEEISSEEVDRVVESLESLMASVDSENIRAILEDATNNVYFLVYDDEADGPTKKRPDRASCRTSDEPFSQPVCVKGFLLRSSKRICPDCLA